jgi:histidine transport system substrate-binding protein
MKLNGKIFRAGWRIVGLMWLGIAAGMAQARDWTVVRLANEGGYAPFSETAPDGSLRGLDVDIGNAICAEMKLKCIWIRVEWEAMIPSLVSNKVDAIFASMTITEERRARIDFTSRYYSAPLALVARAGSPLRPDPATLKGRKVGLLRGTVADDFATRFWNVRGIEIIRYRLQDEVDLDLTAGRLDAVLTDYWQAYGGLFKRPEGRVFAVMGEKIYGMTPEERKVVGEGVGAGVRKKDQDLKKILDQGISAIRSNGTYDRIVRKYFAEDIYGK